MPPIPHARRWIRNRDYIDEKFDSHGVPAGHDGDWEGKGDDNWNTASHRVQHSLSYQQPRAQALSGAPRYWHVRSWNVINSERSILERDRFSSQPGETDKQRVSQSIHYLGSPDELCRIPRTNTAQQELFVARQYVSQYPRGRSAKACHIYQWLCHCQDS